MTSAILDNSPSVSLEYRCGRCWNSNYADIESVGQEQTCTTCGNNNLVPEATPDRIERAAARQETVDLFPIEMTKTKNTALPSKAKPQEFFRVMTDQEMASQANRESIVPLHRRDFCSYPTATALPRIVAWFVDQSLYGTTLILGVLVSGWMSKQGWIANPLDTYRHTETLDAIQVIVLAGPAIALTLVQWTLLAMFGQTIGKMLLNMRVVNMSGRVAGFLQGVLVRNWICHSLSMLVPFFGLIDCILLFTGSARCLHDYLSGTRVVSPS